MNSSLRPTEDLFRSRRDASLGLVKSLIGRGLELSRHLRVRRARDGDAEAARVATDLRLWQHDCGAAINELSGGSKAHWLARAFSAAFLVPSTSGTVVVEAGPVEIVDRLISVLQKAAASLEHAEDESESHDDAAAPRRFDFVGDVELRPVLEQAYRESRRLLERGAYERALATTCGILEAVITDALTHRRSAAQVAALSFDDRIAAAERAGLIRGACARLPAAARTYRSGVDRPVAERDARVAGQVLHVVMRDLNPGR